MRVAALIMVAVLCVGCAPASEASLEEQWRLCQQSIIPAQRLGACSTVVASEGATLERRAAALTQRGMERAQRGQHVRAIADFGRALRIDASLVETYIERGLAHQARGAYASAITDFEAALALAPGSRAGYLREGALELLANADSPEIEQLRIAIERDPFNASLRNNRCWAFAVAGEQLDLALYDCNEALRLSPGDGNYHDSRGLVHLKLENFAAALADYDAAVATEPRNGHFIYGRGIARLRLGMKREGEADLAAAEQMQSGVTALYASYGVAP